METKKGRVNPKPDSDVSERTAEAEARAAEQQRHEDEVQRTYDLFQSFVKDCQVNPLKQEGGMTQFFQELLEKFPDFPDILRQKMSDEPLLAEELSKFRKRDAELAEFVKEELSPRFREIISEETPPTEREWIAALMRCIVPSRSCEHAETFIQVMFTETVPPSEPEKKA
jgi:hypothetical protein